MESTDENRSGSFDPPASDPVSSGLTNPVSSGLSFSDPKDLSITDEEKELMRLAAQAKVDGAKGNFIFIFYFYLSITFLFLACLFSGKWKGSRKKQYIFLFFLFFIFYFYFYLSLTFSFLACLFSGKWKKQKLICLHISTQFIEFTFIRK